MHAFVTSLTAAALLTHAFVGCYGHRALHCPQCEVTVASSLPSSSCCGHDHDVPADEHSPAGPCQCVLSCHGGCVSLPPQKTEIDVAPAAAGSGLVAIDQATPDRLLLASVSCWQRGHIVHSHQPPVRLHLLHQMLLI